MNRDKFARVCTLSIWENDDLLSRSGTCGVMRLKDDNGSRAENVESEVSGRRLGSRGMLRTSANTSTRLLWISSGTENGKISSDVRRGRLGVSFESIDYSGNQYSKFDYSAILTIPRIARRRYE